MSDFRADIEFMPDTYAAEVESLPLASHCILWISGAFVLVAIVWANFATLDEVAHAEGRVIPSSQVQVVQNFEGGILANVSVRAGETVKENQTLLVLDDTRFASSFREGKLTTDALRARIARLEAEIEGTSFTAIDELTEDHADLLEDEKRLYESRQQELDSSLDILRQQRTQFEQGLAELKASEQKLSRNAALAQQELDMTAPLVDKGAVSRVELLRLQAAVNDSLGQLEETRLAIPGSEAAVAEANEKIEGRRQQFISAAQAELTEAKRELSRLNISNVALEDRVNRTTVKSPVDGTVNQVLVNTVGAVIQPGMDLIEIVPANDTLLIEARIRPADIAFIHPGQKATVKLTAYDFSIYGGLDSVLELISADSITDERGEHYFKIQVRTHKNHLGSDDNPLPIIPGMIATVDIMTGEKTVMDYLLKPLRRAQAAALSER
ncbi:MAG: HlyD family type I secretion periplasmic adaptor subunit [Pseudomonadales bacterium]|nr:HlyD family type I secretion periplasmic adaptor subunit [Pseudomonadales bacterium]MBO6595004.1 HlyD family type I secretion periplasmic adaptor subunit [Pseudomonadales bacterium]MBO6821437.1 HlyD family type I secretion periplasmic adaptor subunit [Pseudomonadales bacterium]